MKRSEVNACIEEGMEFFHKMNWALPEFAYWGINEWKENLSRTELTRELMLGWDITDFGSNHYDETGHLVFTIRNGDSQDASKGVPYCEKLIYFRDGQSLPLHFHFKKTEDIINRAGGILVVQCYNAHDDDTVDYQSDVELYIDSIKYTYKAGERIELKNGQSITLTPRIFHLFYAKKGEGPLLVGEVSTINDDKIDNYFIGDSIRFSTIDEDAPIAYPLCNEYASVLFD